MSSLFFRRFGPLGEDLKTLADSSLLHRAFNLGHRNSDSVGGLGADSLRSGCWVETFFTYRPITSNLFKNNASLQMYMKRNGCS